MSPGTQTQVVAARSLSTEHTLLLGDMSGGLTRNSATLKGHTESERLPVNREAAETV